MHGCRLLTEIRSYYPPLEVELDLEMPVNTRDEPNQKELEAGLAPTPGYRYADAVGDQLFVAGQVPLDRSGEIIGDDTAAQATACLDNLLTLVQLHDFERNDIRHLTIYVTGDHADLTGAWNAVVAWWGFPVPPATLLGIACLGHAGQLVEIDATIRRNARGS